MVSSLIEPNRTESGFVFRRRLWVPNEHYFGKEHSLQACIAAIALACCLVPRTCWRCRRHFLPSAFRQSMFIVTNSVALVPSSFLLLLVRHLLLLVRHLLLLANINLMHPTQKFDASNYLSHWTCKTPSKCHTQ